MPGSVVDPWDLNLSACSHAGRGPGEERRAEEELHGKVTRGPGESGTPSQRRGDS